MNISIIGLGLIGGSVSLALKQRGFMLNKVIGSDINPEHRKEALRLGLVDELMDMEQAVEAADLVIIAIPVDATLHMLQKVLHLVKNQVVMDVGSAKSEIC